MPAYNDLKHFISDRMRMSHIYQPVMLLELLRNDGAVSVEQPSATVREPDCQPAPAMRAILGTSDARLPCVWVGPAAMMGTCPR